MDFNNDYFENITIREDVPRIYFHISGMFVLNQLAVKRFSLDKADFVQVSRYKKNKVILSIEVQKDIETVNFKGSFLAFEKHIAQSKEDAYFSYELEGKKTGFRIAKGKELHIMLVLLRRQVESIEYKKTKTHIQEQREKRQQSIDQVKLIFKMDEQQYNTYLFENAYDYFVFRGYDEFLISYLKKSEKFWTWWKNEYYITDSIILETYHKQGLSDISHNELNKWYNEVHSGINIMPDTYIFREFKPNVKVTQQ